MKTISYFSNTVSSKNVVGQTNRPVGFVLPQSEGRGTGASQLTNKAMLCIPPPNPSPTKISVRRLSRFFCAMSYDSSYLGSHQGNFYNSYSCRTVTFREQILQFLLQTVSAKLCLDFACKKSW